MIDFWGATCLMYMYLQSWCFGTPNLADMTK